MDYTNCNIEKVSVHSIGNKTNGEELHVSKSSLDISDARVRELLFKFFLSPFSNLEFYSLSFTNNDFTLNPIYNFASQVFENPKNFHRSSVNIAKHLYELSMHPQIKSGDLFVTYFSDINIEGELTDALGIFKSENRQPFLTLDNRNLDFTIHYDVGINIEKLDKGCLILNTESDSGFRVCIIDKSNKAIEAQYWRDSFLQLKPCSDGYHHTKEYMNITKNFATEQYLEEFEITKADQISLLNRSVEYFKTHDTFDKRDFETKVLQDTGVIKSFRNFDSAYRENSSIELEDRFEISPQAVKKQSRIFKSVLKLDKNFHIYIHGNREMIEQGVEKDGRKYYKIYFKEES